MAALTTLNITEKNANNSLSVTVKVNVTKEGVFTTTLSKEDVDKIHSYGIKLPTNRLGNEGYFNSIALSDLESQIREVLKRCLSYKIKVFPQNMIRNIIAEPAELKTVRSILKPDIAFTVIRITGFQKMTNS